MGIQGLIPFLEKSSEPVNVKRFSGNTVAVDAYCWLHKGVFSCADRLARGEDCKSYVLYCMKFVNMLLSFNIKPILVFDGQKLPAKKITEKKRKDLREQSRKKAAELMRMDRGKEALVYLRQSVDVTHEMALNFIQACRSQNVDCIVAPYEADAQLAYLNLQNIAQAIITEDSDLLLFGAKKVLFKMDINGNGLLIEREKLHLSLGEKPENFSFDKFRYMCILSGCDYLPSLPGIGLAKACRFVKRTVDPDIHRAISRIASHLNMPNLKVTQEYRDNFVEADFMFKFQPVFDPVKKKLVPLTSVSEDDENYKKFTALVATNNLSSHQVCHLAYGNLDPFTLRQLDDWIPGRSAPLNDKYAKTKCINGKIKHPSIWDTDFVPCEKKESQSTVPNALQSMKSSVTTSLNEKSSSSWFKKSCSNPEKNVQSSKSLKEQLQKLKSMYEVENQSEGGEDSCKSIMNSQSSDEGIKSEDSFVEQECTVTNSAIREQNTKEYSVKMKIRNALSKFSCPYKLENNENLSDTFSCYFSSNSSAAASPSSSTNDDSFSCVRNLDDIHVGSQSPIFNTQRSPLKDKNNDDESHLMSAVKIHDSTPTELCNVSPVISNTRKRLNPFAISSCEKIIRTSRDELIQSPSIRSDDSNLPKEKTTFKWTESIEDSSNRIDEMSNRRWSADIVDANVSNALNDETDDASRTLPPLSETSPILSGKKKSNCRNSLPARSDSKCRLPGLAKKSALKQTSLLSAFVCSKPQKLKL